MGFTLVFYGLAVVLLVVSFFKDRIKTVSALKKAGKLLAAVLPQFLAIVVAVGALLAVLSPEAISRLLGKSSGWFGTLLASLVGSITLIPGFIAFPMAAMLLKNGADYTQMAAFISTLMMVGVVTLPMEIKYFNRRFALVRNGAAYVFSLFVALAIGLVMSL